MIYTNDIVIEKGIIVGVKFNVLNCLVAGRLTEKGYIVFLNEYPSSNLIDNDRRFCVTFSEFVHLFSRFELAPMLGGSLMLKGQHS